MDDVTLKRLARLGALPGVRDYSLLWALLPSRLASESGEGSCVNSTTQKDTEAPNSLTTSATDQTDTEDEDELGAVVGIPVWNHGMLEQAKLTPVRHAVHLMRHLDDYHEPTLAALRWQRLRKLVDASPDERLRACQATAEAFLEQPNSLARRGGNGRPSFRRACVRTSFRPASQRTRADKGTALRQAGSRARRAGDGWRSGR